MHVRDDIHIPTADDLGIAWLRRIRPDCTARSAAVSPVGTGQLADTHRLNLRYGVDQGNCPDSVICKIASANPDSRAIARQWSLYEREVRFYRELAPGARIDTPDIKASGLDAEGNFFLLMEDMAGAVPGNQIAGILTKDGRRAMCEAARLHAAFWGTVEDPSRDWLETGRQAQAFYPQEVFRSIWPGFRDRYADALLPEQIATCDRFADLYEAYSAPPARPRCLVHNDFRPDNMLFSPDRLVVVDWQSVARGYNAVDIAYLIGGAFDPAVRVEVEGLLLDVYHEELRAQGVEGYSRQELWQDYRQFAFAGIVVSVCAAMLVKRTERGDRLFLTMLDRHLRHVADCAGMELLRELA